MRPIKAIRMWWWRLSCVNCSRPLIWRGEAVVCRRCMRRLMGYGPRKDLS